MPLPISSWIKRFIEHCQCYDSNSQPITHFWRFYYQQKLQVQYVLDAVFNYPSSKLKYIVKHIKEIWWFFRFRPIMAMMIMHGDLQLKDPEVAMTHFGNLPRYCVEFVCKFMYQLYHIDPNGDVY
jgi:hypothetical protein